MTKSNILTGLAFVGGIAIGAICSSKYFNRKYNAIAQEEIDSVKEAFHRDIEPEAEAPTDEKQPEKDYDELVLDEKYNSTDDAIPNDVYLIDPADIGEKEDYDVIEFTYYSGDGVVVDENDDVVENIDELVGADFSDKYGEYESDSVAFRNDKRRCDFEILLDYRKWSDVVNHVCN